MSKQNNNVSWFDFFGASTLIIAGLAIIGKVPWWAILIWWLLWWGGFLWYDLLKDNK